MISQGPSGYEPDELPTVKRWTILNQYFIYLKLTVKLTEWSSYKVTIGQDKKQVLLIFIHNNYVTDFGTEKLLKLNKMYRQSYPT